MTTPIKTKFDPAFPIADKEGKPTQQFRDYMVKIDLLLTYLAAGNFANPLNMNALTNEANDSAAAAAGVTVGQAYRNGSVIQVRVV
jgi:hypothetical protein